VGFDVTVQLEKAKYVFLCRHQNVSRNWGIQIANRSFENV
jgi:hypothetical protein